MAALAPPWSVVYWLSAVVLAECKIRGKAASMVVMWPAGTMLMEFTVMQHMAVELSFDTNKIITARVSDRPELDALDT